MSGVKRIYCRPGVLWCSRCELEGHDHFDGPDVCARYYKGPRNRRPDALRPVDCLACRLVASFRETLRKGQPPRVHYETAGKLLIEHGHDIDAALADIEWWDGPSGDSIRHALEAARRNDPYWGIEFRDPTPEQRASHAEWAAMCAAREGLRAAVRPVWDGARYVETQAGSEEQARIAKYIERAAVAARKAVSQ